MQHLHTIVDESTDSGIPFMRHKLTQVATHGFAKEMWVLPLNIATHVIAGGASADSIIFCNNGVCKVDSFDPKEMPEVVHSDDFAGKILYLGGSSPPQHPVRISSGFVSAARRLGAIALCSSAACMHVDGVQNMSEQPRLALPVVLRCNQTALNALVSQKCAGAVVVLPLNYGHVSRQVLPSCLIHLKRSTPIRVIKDISPGLTATSATLKGDVYSGQPPLLCPAQKHIGAAILTCDILCHVDSPAHFCDGGRSISDLTAQELHAPCCVIDISSKTEAALKEEEDPAKANVELTVADLQNWETTYGKQIPPGAVVCLRSGWVRRINEADKYRNTSKGTGAMNFPGFSAEAAAFLLERRVGGLGVDTLSVDVGSSTSFPVHKQVLGAGCFNVENCDFSDLPPACTIVVAPLLVRDAPEAPARVIAIE